MTELLVESSDPLHLAGGLTLRRTAVRLGQGTLEVDIVVEGPAVFGMRLRDVVAAHVESGPARILDVRAGGGDDVMEASLHIEVGSSAWLRLEYFRSPVASEPLAVEVLRLRSPDVFGKEAR